MTSYLVAGPAMEPVSVEEAIEYCKAKIEDSSLMSTLIASARLHIEAQTGLALMSQTWQWVLDPGQAPMTIRLPVRPVRSVIKVAGQYDVLNEIGKPASIIAASVPIIVTYEAGFGPARGDVPADLRAAILYLCKDWYENGDELGRVRNPYVNGTVSKWREMK